MKNLKNSVTKKLIEKYMASENQIVANKRTDINVLLNRVKLDRKQEVLKKFYFSAAASTGLILFGLIIFS